MNDALAAAITAAENADSAYDTGKGTVDADKTLAAAAHAKADAADGQVTTDTNNLTTLANTKNVALDALSQAALADKV